MDQDKTLTTEQSLYIITEMIDQAKGKVRENSIYFIIWGVVITLANLGMFSLMLMEYRYPYISWSIAVPAWIITIYTTWRQSKKARTNSHLDRISGSLWLSFGVIIFTLVAFGKLINYQLNPVILLLSALPTFVSGIIIKFKPLIFGGFSFWLLGIACFLVGGPWQFLVGALAVIVGFLIPGIILRNKREN